MVLNISQGNDNSYANRNSNAPVSVHDRIFNRGVSSVDTTRDVVAASEVQAAPDSPRGRGALRKSEWHNYSGWTKDTTDKYEKEASSMRASLGSMGVSQDSEHWKNALGAIEGRYDENMARHKDTVTYRNLEREFNAKTSASGYRRYHADQTAGKDPRTISERVSGVEWSKTADISSEEWAGVDEYSKGLRDAGLDSYFETVYGQEEMTAEELGKQAQEDSETAAANVASGVAYEKPEDEEYF